MSPAVTSESHPSQPVSPTALSTRPTWPITAGAVLLGWCYGAWALFVAAINTAPFFGDQPSRSENIESGLALATACVPLLLLAALAVRWGSRWGILLLVAPALLFVPLGLDWASGQGDAMDPDPSRPIAWSDFGSDLLRPTWVLTVLLLLILTVSVVRSRRAVTHPVDRPGA